MEVSQFSPTLAEPILIFNHTLRQIISYCESGALIISMIKAFIVSLANRELVNWKLTLVILPGQKLRSTSWATSTSWHQRKVLYSTRFV